MKIAFEELKDGFQKGVILQFLDLSKDWWITVDSSAYAFGGTLEQEDSKSNLRPVALCSKKLQGTRTKRLDGSYHKTGQLNWHNSDKKMYRIVATLYKELVADGAKNQVTNRPQKLGVLRERSLRTHGRSKLAVGPAGTGSLQGTPWGLSTPKGMTTERRMCGLGRRTPPT